MTVHSVDQLISALESSLLSANLIIQATLSQGLTTQLKPDGSLVTNADMASHRAIQDTLASLTPHIPLVSEEDPASWNLGESGIYWLVDPIDGTSSMVNGEPNYVILLALMVNQRPVLGGIAVPSRQEVNVGYVQGQSAWRIHKSGHKSSLGMRTPPPDHQILVTSSRGVVIPDSDQVQVQVVSSGIKFVMLSDGSADIYQRSGYLNDWDVAGGEALLLAAGGEIQDLLGRPLVYGTKGRILPPFRAQAKA